MDSVEQEYRAELDAMSDDDLAGIVQDMNLSLRKNASREKVIDAIIAGLKPEQAVEEHIQDYPPAIADQEPVETKPDTPEPSATQAVVPAIERPSVADIEAAVAPYVRAGMVIVKLVTDYWHFRAGVWEAAGNTAIPLKQIVQQAQLLMVKDTVAPPTQD